MPLLTDEDRKLLQALKETAEKHKVEITMPTHDHLTIHSPRAGSRGNCTIHR